MVSCCCSAVDCCINVGDCAGPACGRAYHNASKSQDVAECVPGDDG